MIVNMNFNIQKKNSKLCCTIISKYKKNYLCLVMKIILKKNFRNTFKILNKKDLVFPLEFL